jgi:hypothetical protein
MLITQLIGAGFLALGFLSVSSYYDDLAMFRLPFFHKELKPMQERWGRIAGTALHALSYVIAPLGFGLFFLSGQITFS